MAWIEPTGRTSWRVRYYRDDGSEGSIGGFHDEKTADDYANDMEADQRRGLWIDPAGGKTTVSAWVQDWVETLDVETRTEENYRRYLQVHILPHWGRHRLGEVTALDVTAWTKQLHHHLAHSTVTGILCVFSMLMDDAADQRLIPTSPVHRRRRRGRRRDHHPSPAERVWAMPERILHIADQAGMLGGADANLLIITAAWTGCRWGELAGLQRDHVDLDPIHNRGVIIIDPDTGALHESNHHLWLGPPKTPASARVIQLPPFLVALLRKHLANTAGRRSEFVFTSPLGYPLRRSDFDRRVFRPAVDGNRQRPNARVHTEPVRPGLTFHGLRHSHKTWMIADGIPEIAQARRLGHHLSNRIVETYSHVAPEIERALIRALERRWHHATRRPVDTRPQRGPHAATAHHTHSARRRTPPPQLPTTPPQVSAPTFRHDLLQRARKMLQNCSTSVHPRQQPCYRNAIFERVRTALRPATTPERSGKIWEWS
jgi:integrase